MVKNPKTRLYNLPVPVIGITGGIATGKSSVSQILQKHNYPLIDADKLVKEIYKEKIAINFIKDNFNDVVSEKNEINFKKLRKIFFSDIDAKEKIEEFIYQRLPQKFHEVFSKFNNPNFIFYDMPLIFEKSLQDKFDLIILVYLAKDEQIERMIKRDNISFELAEKILKHQDPIDSKIDRSNIIIKNSGSIHQLEEATLEAVKSIEFINK